MRGLPGDCLTCTNLSSCTETSTRRVLESYTCPLFVPVAEPVYLARIDTMKKYGSITAIKAMLWSPDPKEEGEDG